MTRVLAPSDLPRAPAARRASVRVVRVGGRVVDCGADGLTLADALTAVRVSGDWRVVTPSLSAGDLLLVDVRVLARRLELVRVVEQRPCPVSDAFGEFARMSWDGVGRLLEARATALHEIRRWFARERFLEVDTPVRVRVPGSDPHVTALRAHDGWLITSPEHHMKRLLVGGIPRLFQLARASRGEELGSWHEPEFVMLEWYRAFAEPSAILRDTERVVCRVFDALRSYRSHGTRRALHAPFERIGVAEAFRRWASVRDVFELARSDEQRYFELFVDRVEPALARLGRPVFLVDFPLTQAALARPSPRDPRAADWFELYFGGVELCNGYGELTDPDELVRRHAVESARRTAAGEPVYPLDERLVTALREGMPAASGNALGVDRLIALACGQAEIGRVVAFPATRV